ncbi:MAG TPA: secretin N-terminal domain-containing protein [Bacillota bacterium]|nr:secretin N-terminal domain-containing protein [Bacillota bacterium]
MFKLKPERYNVRWLLIFCLVALIFSSIVQAETKKLIELDFKGADIKDVLRALADKGGVTFVIEPDVTATVTIHLSNKTFTDALNLIATTYHLSVKKEESFYHISQIDTSTLKVEFEDGKLSVEASSAKLQTLFNIITQKTGKNLVLDPQITDRGSVIINKVPLEEAIKVLLAHFNLITQPNGINVIRKSIIDIIDNTTKIEYQNGKLMIDAKNVPLQTLTRSITQKTNVSIVPDNNLNPNVSIYVQDVSIDDALAVLCDTNNLGLSKDSSIFRIYKLNNSFRVSFKNNALSVDADGAEAEALFSEISRQTGVLIQLDRDLRAQIKINFKSVPFSQGLTYIADSVGWVIEKRGTAYALHYNTTQNPNIRIYYNPETKLFDIDVSNASLPQIINEMARKADLNIALSNQINWAVNGVRLTQVTVYEAFDFLLKTTIFSFKEIDGVFLFSDSLYPRAETADFSETHVYQIKYLKSDQVMNTLPATFPRQDFMNLQEKNALIVTGPPNIHAMFVDYLNQIDIERIDDRTEVIKIKHLKAEDVLKYLPNSIPKQDIIVIKEMNAITVSGPQNLMNQIRQYIDKIDQPNPMIVFDIKVIKISNSNEVNWNPPTVNGLGVGSKTENFGYLPLTSDPGSVIGAITSLDALVTNGKAKILQNPVITTLNGSTATFNVSSKRYYQVKSGTSSSGSSGSGTPTPVVENTKPEAFDNSLTISITPWVAANNQITMEIKPRIREYGAVSESGYPDTSEHATETTIRVNNNQTVVISGLKTTRKEKSVSKLPLFGDIPLLGFFFRKSKNTDVQDEFVIIIKPTLVYDDATQADMNQQMQNILGTAINGFTTPIPTPTGTPTPALSSTTAQSSTAAQSSIPVLSPTAVPSLTAAPMVTPTPTPMYRPGLTPTKFPSRTSIITPTPTRARTLTSSGLKPGSKNHSLYSEGGLFPQLQIITMYLTRVLSKLVLAPFPVFLNS